jgi:hypothetical protein
VISGTYVCGGELLVGGDDGAATLGGVECALSLDGGLAVGTRATGLAADLGDGVPVAHFGGVVVGVGCCFEGWSCEGVVSVVGGV